MVLCPTTNHKSREAKKGQWNSKKGQDQRMAMEKWKSRRNLIPRCYAYRSTSARLVDSRSLGRKTYQARRQQTKNSRLKISYKNIRLFPLFVYKWYVVVMYQPCAHKCNSCKRYVVVTYRSIIFLPRKSTYPIRVIQVNSSRLGRNNYGTNGYSFIFPTIFLYHY